ncbi:CoxG family protein [Trinickia fusca]|uniref:Carbon monoxide dehydrogenase n=1 Tax=Trinickia fusca TaxID=2419777 RepID=A0A494X8J9_9BURK|nr:carbon monoxide dehydrogenase subunit G [Trinickia fusca]RKP44369.1 carbon monoxide dehydrogenase [Trinickia fusca]
MELTESYTLPVPPQRAWEALTDAAVLRASIPGCERMEANGEHAYALAMDVSLGGVKARFKGHMRMTDIDAPRACTLLFEGEPASVGSGSAQLRLEPEGSASTTLSCTTQAKVGLNGPDAASEADGTVRAIADEFVRCFAAHITGEDREAPQPPEPSVQHAAVAESAPAGRGEKSQKAWTARF